MGEGKEKEDQEGGRTSRNVKGKVIRLKWEGRNRTDAKQRRGKEMNEGKIIQKVVKKEINSIRKKKRTNKSGRWKVTREEEVRCRR